MRLYIIRHGKAKRHSDSGLDEDRRLAERGHAQARWLGGTLAQLDPPPAVLLTSPADRARQTAELVGEELGLTPSVEDRLGLGGSASEIIDLIADLDPNTPAALFGHNPTLSILVDVLCRGPTGAGSIELRTGQAAVLDLLDGDSPMGVTKLVGLLRSDD